MQFLRTLKRFGLLVSAGALFLLAMSGNAFAAGSASVTSNRVTFTAGSGDTNNLTYDWSTSGWLIADVNTITAGTGCTVIDSYTVRCGGSFSFITLNLGDQNDQSDGTDPTSPMLPIINGGDGNDTIYTSNGNETVNGGNGDDTVYGDGGTDTLNGGAGDDTLDGGDANDVLDGGADDDVFTGGNGTDTVTYASRSGDLYVEIAGVGGEAGEYDTISAYNGVETYTLGSGDDEFYGAWATHEITVNGGYGNDILYGGNYVDNVYAGSGDDEIRTYDGDDFIYPSNGADDIYGGDDFDTVAYTTAGILGAVDVNIDGSGGDGADGADGNVHTDVEKLIGSTYGDTFVGQAAAASTLFGASGDDTLSGGSAADTLDGASGDDEITPGGGSDTVNAGSDDDLVYADDGVADTIDCSLGSSDDAFIDEGVDSATNCEFTH